MSAQLDSLLKRSTFAQRARAHGWTRAAFEQLLDFAESYVNTRTPFEAGRAGSLGDAQPRTASFRHSEEF